MDCTDWVGIWVVVSILPVFLLVNLVAEIYWSVATTREKYDLQRKLLMELYDSLKEVKDSEIKEISDRIQRILSRTRIEFPPTRTKS